jgi:hypothetical protein
MVRKMRGAMIRSASPCAASPFGLLARAFLFVGLVSSVADAGAANQRPAGSFKCLYVGTWGCAPANSSGGICVDSGRPQRERFALQLNFESKPFPRLRLNGLDGHLLQSNDPSSYLVVWHLGGLGQPELSTLVHPDGSIDASFVEKYPNGGTESSRFKCSRLPRPLL